MLELHEPPSSDAVNIVGIPIHTSTSPLIEIGELGTTVSISDSSDIQPVLSSMNVNTAVPGFIPVTTPLLLIKATA